MCSATSLFPAIPQHAIDGMTLSNQCLVRKAHQPVKMFEEISDLTMEIIAHCVLGDYGEGQVLDDMRRIVPKAVDGMVSKPRKFPWPLNRLPGNNFGSGMAARKKFDKVIGGVLRQRRSDLSAAHVRTCRLRVYLDPVWSHYLGTLICSNIELGECPEAWRPSCSGEPSTDLPSCAC